MDFGLHRRIRSLRSKADDCLGILTLSRYCSTFATTKKDLLKKCTGYRQDGLKSLQYVVDLFNAAKKTDETRKRNCLNEKLTATKALLLISE
jgi:hypothetical protein